MVGRSGWCLLVAGFVISVSAFIAGQAGASARVTPRVLTERASGQMHPRRIVRPSRPPLPPLPRPVPLPGVFGFPTFVRAAGMIFSGTVTRIERRAASGGQSVETVAVTFHVENAVRGAIRGQDLTITQWIGLWSSGQRYRVGSAWLCFCIRIVSWD
jgi:hypothetical protein